MIFCKKLAFSDKNATFTYESCVRDFLFLFSVFVKSKVIVNENVSFIDHASGIRLLDGCKLAINSKKAMTSQFADMTSSSIFLTFLYFSCQVYPLVRVLCQYNDWFWSYGNFYFFVLEL